jgi:hypothetical protein
MNAEERFEEYLVKNGIEADRKTKVYQLSKALWLAACAEQKAVDAKIAADFDGSESSIRISDAIRSQ